VGHLGAVTIDDILSLASTLEEVSLQFGRAIEPGRAVEAAERAGHAVEANRPSPRDAVAGVPAGG
jgi:aspartate aminotransferase-like enzyme